MNRRTMDRNNRRKDLKKSLEQASRGGITTHTAKLMAEPLGGKPAQCTITGHCCTYLFEFPGSYLASEEPVNHQIIYSRDGLKVAIVSDLPAYFEHEPAISLHYSIDVSLRVGVSRIYEGALKQSKQRSDPTLPLFLVIEEYSEISPTVLNIGQCFTINECRDGEAMIEGGREGERALIAFRTVDAPWPDFHADTHVINVVLTAIKVEQNISGHIEELYSCSCFVNSEGHALYTLSPSLGAASGSVMSRLETLDLYEKAVRIGSMLEAMMSDSEPVAMEVFDSIVLDKTRDDGYLRLWYLRLWEAVEDAKRHLEEPELLNKEEAIAGKRTPKELKDYRNDIAHWNIGRINYSCLSDLQHTAIELLRRKYGASRDH